MPPQKKLLRGWSRETTERSLLMRRLPFVSMKTGSMDFQVRPCRRRCVLTNAGSLDCWIHTVPAELDGMGSRHSLFIIFQ
jgi:hypothetical protein